MAIANNLPESWICFKPVLPLMYASQYMPSVSKWVFQKFLGKNLLSVFWVCKKSTIYCISCVIFASFPRIRKLKKHSFTCLCIFFKIHGFSLKLKDIIYLPNLENIVFKILLNIALIQYVNSGTSKLFLRGVKRGVSKFDGA